MTLEGRLSQEEVFAVFPQAERVLFFSASIAIQQAMLLGCPVVLPKSCTLNALLEEGRNGFYYEHPEGGQGAEEYPYPHLLQGLNSALEKTKSQSFSREELKKFNQGLSAEYLLKKLLG